MIHMNYIELHLYNGNISATRGPVFPLGRRYRRAEGLITNHGMMKPTYRVLLLHTL